MKTWFWILTILIHLFTSNGLKAQQDAQFTLFNNQFSFFNPAYTGIRSNFHAILSTRKQWTSLPGSPLSMYMHVAFKNAEKRLALGTFVLEDRLAVQRQTQWFVSTAYHLPLRNYTLSFGIHAGIQRFNVGLSDLALQQSGDPSFASDIVRNFFNTGTGVYLYSNKLHIGVSLPRLLTPHFESTVSNQAQLSRHYFISGGYLFTVSPQIEVKTMALVKFVQAVVPQIDLHTMAYFNENFGLGITLRNADAVAISAMCSFTKQIQLMYAYDIDFNGLYTHTHGTHEISLLYDLFRKQTLTVSPRYF